MQFHILRLFEKLVRKLRGHGHIIRAQVDNPVVQIPLLELVITGKQVSQGLMTVIRQSTDIKITGASVVVTVGDYAAPSVPTGLVATAVSSSQINLNWNASTDTSGVMYSGMSKYRVRRGGSFLVDVNHPTLTYSNTGLSSFTNYSYTVSALDVAGNESAQSASANATTFNVSLPAQVTGLTATAVSASQIDLSWNAASGATTYTVRRAGTVIQTGLNGLTYSNGGLAASTNYSYTVAGVNAAGEGPQSASANATTQAGSGLQWPAPTPNYLPIIPGAAGFGMDTVAGSGRSASVTGGNNFGSHPIILFIDSLSTAISGSLNGDGTGQGTLKWCCQAPARGGANTGGAPRVVIPLVSGVTNFGGTSNYPTDKTTVAFQCAPDPGLWSFGLSWRNQGSNILLWHVSSFFSNSAGGGNQQAFWPEVFGGGAHWQNHVYANCLAAWNKDEGFSENGSTGGTWDYTEYSTYWNCLALQSRGERDNTADPLYGVGKSALFTFSSRFFSFLRGAMLHNVERNPLVRSPNFAYSDCLIYNYDFMGLDIRKDLTPGQSELVRLNAECNIFMTGPNINQGGSGHNGPIKIGHNGEVPLAGSQIFLRGNAAVGESIIPAQGSLVSTAQPNGYTALTMSFGSGNQSNATLAQVLDKGTLILSGVGPRPKTGKRLPYLQTEINTAQARLNGTGSGLGAWKWFTSKTVPVVSDMGTVAQNSISVADAKHASGSVWGNDPLPWDAANANTQLRPGTMHSDNSGYTTLERWLQRRNAVVMP